MIKLIIVTR